MRGRLPYPAQSVLFAPMEGVTDPVYRKVIANLYPEWDHYFTDFLRVPTQGSLKSKHVMGHYGQDIYDRNERRTKNSFQILTSARAQIEMLVSLLENYEFPSLDLNLGCPSKKVNAHKGGAYLLSDLTGLSQVVRTIRKNYTGCFTAKIRLGYRDTKMFTQILELLEGEGVEAITIHGRTRDELYKGVADWSLIQKATKTVSIPIIGNGDLWNVEDIEKAFNETDLYGVMIGRGALKTPWLASHFRQYQKDPYSLNDDFQGIERIGNLQLYFQNLEREYKSLDNPDSRILSRFKSLSRYPFDDLPGSESIKTSLLRAKTLDEFNDILYGLG
jgi:tRNA-dihydrouridine synthase